MRSRNKNGPLFIRSSNRRICRIFSPPRAPKSGKEEIQDNLIAPSPCSQQFFQLCLSLFDAQISKILSVEPQQIKGVEDSSTARKSRGETVLAASGGFIGRVLT
jgi:hypothetical protein